MNDARTRQYTGGAVATTPVAIAIGDSINTAGGQIALLACVNAAVRNHPIVYVSAPNVPLLAPSTGMTHEALDHLGTATDTSQLEIIDDRPSGVVVLGIGEDVGNADLYLGADRFTGQVSAAPAAITAEPSSAWGGAIAAMMATNAAFRTAIALPVPVLPPLSLWTFAEQPGASGPAELGPISVGTTWLIGAGGIGSSIAWWLSLLGVEGSWFVIDHERIDITNLNRSLGMFIADFGAGGDEASFKADVAARLIGATAFAHDWDAWAAADPAPPDVIIPAANERGVRAALASYSHPMALSGTTSRNWTAELHLYRSGTDGCLDCRHPTTGTAQFACSTSTIPAKDGKSTDAALSFLSGTAGLLTLAGLARLQVGELVGPMNNWQLSFQPTHRPITPNRHPCARGCHQTLDEQIRSALFGDTRWA